jgi:CheY-like chemotaxis protein
VAPIFSAAWRDPTHFCGYLVEKKGLNPALFRVQYSWIQTMYNASTLPDRRRIGQNLGLARVLLLHADLAPRLTLQTILQAGGYTVDVAASQAEAMFKLDDGQYELVLTDNRIGCDVLAYARVKAYRPATGVVMSSGRFPEQRHRRGPEMSIHTENLASLLEDVAELIGARARRRLRPLRQLG